MRESAGPERFDYLIVGAGIVGLAVAFEISSRHPEALIGILEKESAPGMHASGRNSGVLHSGIYYSASSLKARVCAAGARRMREFAQEHGIAVGPFGKVIVASQESDLPVLDRLVRNAQENHIRYECLDEAGIKKIEPHAAVYRSGLYVPEACVIDSAAVIRTLAGLLAKRGVVIMTGRAVKSVNPDRRQVDTSAGPCRYAYLFNCAGAYADRIAAYFGLGADFALVPFKGIYFQLVPERTGLVKSNIYPVPDDTVPFLGVHFTRVAGGHVHVGPTAIPAFGRENYGILEGLDLGEAGEIVRHLFKMYFGRDEKFRNLVHQEFANYLKPVFVSRARRLIPEVRERDLVPCAKVGIRPQLVNRKTGRLEMDYVLEQTPESLHVLNAISPAFTSSLEFAKVIADLAGVN